VERLLTPGTDVSTVTFEALTRGDSAENVTVDACSQARECDARGMARIDPYEIADDDEGTTGDPPALGGRDRDGVSALRDTEAEAGDESGIDDVFDMDDREARELGVNLDDRDEPEPGLD